MIVNCVELTSVAACTTPLYVTVDPDTKSVPISVSVSEPAPAIAEAGDKAVRLGTELLFGAAAGASASPAERAAPTQAVHRSATRIQTTAKLAVLARQDSGVVGLISQTAVAPLAPLRGPLLCRPSPGFLPSCNALVIASRNANVTRRGLVALRHFEVACLLSPAS